MPLSKIVVVEWQLICLLAVVMASLDDIFGGLAGIVPHVGDPDRQHIPTIPFPCAEDVIEHHEHGPNMSLNASFEVSDLFTMACL